MEGALYITDSDGNPNVLNANRNDDGQWVDAHWGNPGPQWHDDGVFVFLVSANLFFPRKMPKIILRGFVFLFALAIRPAFYQFHPAEQTMRYIFCYPEILFPKAPAKVFSKYPVFE